MSVCDKGISKLDNIHDDTCPLFFVKDFKLGVDKTLLVCIQFLIGWLTTCSSNQVVKNQLRDKVGRIWIVLTGE